MMIVEGLKRLGVIEKRMEKHIEEIRTYASGVDTERPLFGSTEKQRAEVACRVQSNKDLFDEYLVLMRRVEATNLSTQVTIKGRKITLAELLWIRRKMGKLIVATYAALNRSAGQTRLHGAPIRTVNGAQQPPQIEAFFDEAGRNARMADWQEFLEEIDSRLEVVNATTSLLNPPAIPL